MVSIENISFGYENKEKILKNINLDIKQGECILLCGESGCGKTTVTKLINGLIPHFCEKHNLEGKVFLSGRHVAGTELYELAKSVGSVFQNPKSQFFNLDTDSELSFGMENEGMPPEEMKKRLKDTIEKLQLKKLLGRNIFSLSGGEKQTLAFASVYAMNPAVYVLDEPTANLDTQAIERLRKQIGILKREGHTVIVAEHRLYFLYDCIDRAFYLKNGKILCVFSKEEFHKLTDDARISMGLRSIQQAEVTLPQALPGGRRDGLSAEELSCGYKKAPPVFGKLSFSAIPGEILAITGYNGIGKTTLIRCLCGLVRERDGKVFLEGKEMSARSRRKQSFLVMQDVNHQLFSDSVLEECKMAGREHTEEQIRCVLEKLGLLPFLEQHPMALSGGQKQRLAIATAILSGKKILIFDEPTSGLDYVNMRAVSEVIRQLADANHIILVVTHDREFMQCACDRVLEIK
ncbi:ABC transporter ATP-binding protein [Anaerocolumna xylanovorans]|uniref:Monosaccharide ABC transporter ATP-binding protein, CUT2 family (TC 3.A.1.2.-) n=1 Tax=Anaerocolumna xylanovorans DSM 12503 TaxID=1121345 RepID=A0A1M7YM40_9FIRM|nr:energy-coupling factor ABC transporter ATP-binding protein [Anaerocolumna xylanovorans]SHO53652.1 monosaccharide ABC transporter ATP-binding protein, CUT2 family (TC 3.A.1.2.-) [Anaerocolumna xylanovorans DSM 12503]